MLDMACNSTNICSYGIKQHKPKPSKYDVSLQNLNDAWLQQNQLLQQNLLDYEQSFVNQGQPNSSPPSSSTSFPTLQYLLEQGKKRVEDRSALNVSQVNPYNDQYNSQYNNQIAPYVSSQAASSVPVQSHYQSPMTPSRAEQQQHLQYQQQNVYCENGQSYLLHDTYPSNYNSLPMNPPAITQNLRSPVRPLLQDDLYSTQQYVAQQNYTGNNSKQQDQTAASNQESSVVRPPREILQEGNLYATQQYVAQQSYTGNNNEQQSHIAADDPKIKQQPIHYAWMKFKHDPGNEKRARKRQTYTQQQTFRLEEVFYGSRYLSKAERVKLSKQLNLSEQQIKIWFQNRRMKAKKEQQQQLPVNQQRLTFSETLTREQSTSQEESAMHQQQSIVQQQSTVEQQWPTTQQPQLHQTQDYQNCSQQQYPFRCEL